MTQAELLAVLTDCCLTAGSDPMELGFHLFVVSFFDKYPALRDCVLREPLACRYPVHLSGTQFHVPPQFGESIRLAAFGTLINVSVRKALLLTYGHKEPEKRIFPDLQSLRSHNKCYSFHFLFGGEVDLCAFCRIHPNDTLRLWSDVRGSKPICKICRVCLQNGLPWEITDLIDQLNELEELSKK
jgi:hypothetical protein